MNKTQKISLFSVVGLTVVLTLFVIVKDVMTYLSIKQAMEEIALYNDEIAKNTAKKPSYAKTNEDNIKKDMAEMKKLVKVLKYQYGKPHRKALQKFIDAVQFNKTVKTVKGGKDGKDGKDGKENMIVRWDELDFYAAFAAHYNASTEKGALSDNINDKKIWDKFLRKLYTVKPSVPVDPAEFGKSEMESKPIDNGQKEKIDKAFAEFEKYAKSYIEYRAHGSGYKCMLDALGLPLTSDFTDLEKVVLEQKYWYETIPGLKELEYNTEEAEKKILRLLFSYDAVLNRLNENQYVLAYRQFQIKQDLFKRMRDAKIVKVESIELISEGTPENNSVGSAGTAQPVDPMAGKTTRGFLVYTYKIKLKGSMTDVRQFLNNLSSAYVDYRIYNVRDLVLKREFQEERMENILKEDTSKVQEGQEVPDSYGRKVIGRDLNIDCEILVDYVMYVQDLLPRQSNQKEAGR